MPKTQISARGSRALKILKCVKNKQCGGRCLAVGQICRQDTPKAAKLVKYLTAGRKVNKLKKGAPRIQYITQPEARLMRAVVSSKDSLQMMNVGRAPHPLIKINKVSQKDVDNVLNILKKTDQKAFLAKLSSAGIRAQGSEKSLSADAQRRIYVEAFLRQGGRDFYTGRKINISLASLDHLVPLSKGGTNTSENLVLTARNVNFWKKDNTQEQLVQLLKLRTNSVDPSSGARMREALLKGDRAEVLKLRKAATEEIRKKEIQEAKDLAFQLKKGLGKKASIYESFNNMQWITYNTREQIDKLSGSELKELLRAQGNETSKSSQPLVYKWRSSPTQSGGQQALPKQEAQRAQAMIQIGVPRNEIPAAYLAQLKEAISTNVSNSGRRNLRVAFGPEYDDLFDGN